MRCAQLAALSLLLLFSASAAAEPHRVALVIGANAGDRDEVVLRYAESDAQRIGRVLRSVGNFHSEDVVIATGGTADEVRRALIGLNARIRQNARETLLFVFYSGHADAETLHLAGTRLPMSELKGLVAGSPASARVLVIDACRSGALTRVKGGRQAPSFEVQIERPLGAQGLAILTSSAAGEDSQESDQLGASFFTHYLSSALIGAADRDRNGEVTLGEAFSYAAERTQAATASTVVGPQHPTYRVELGGRDDLVLARPGALTRSLGVLEFLKPGWYLVHREGVGGAVAAELKTQDARRRLTLDAGRYQVTRRDADHLLQGEVVVRAGAVTLTQPAEMRRVDYARVVRKGGTERTRALSLFAVGGVRGDLLDLGTAWRTELGTRLDLSALSLELRVGLSMSDHSNLHLDIEGHELSTSLAALRSFDIGKVVLGVGLEVGGTWLAQSFHNERTPDRDSYGLFVGPLVVTELSLGPRVYLRIDAAFLTYVLPVGNDPTSTGTGTPITYRACGGVGFYL